VCIIGKTTSGRCLVGSRKGIESIMYVRNEIGRESGGSLGEGYSDTSRRNSAIVISKIDSCLFPTTKVQGGEANCKGKAFFNSTRSGQGGGDPVTNTTLGSKVRGGRRLKTLPHIRRGEK